jgi:hypothetical protein
MQNIFICLDFVLLGVDVDLDGVHLWVPHFVVSSVHQYLKYIHSKMKN